jgi:hypothetical protein
MPLRDVLTFHQHVTLMGVKIKRLYERIFGFNLTSILNLLFLVQFDQGKNGKQTG